MIERQLVIVAVVVVIGTLVATAFLATGSLQIAGMNPNDFIN